MSSVRIEFARLHAQRRLHTFSFPLTNMWEYTMRLLPPFTRAWLNFFTLTFSLSVFVFAFRLHSTIS
jgi:hypothetical protein